MLRDLLGRVSFQELRVLLGECMGPTGQYGCASDEPNTFYLPQWGASCQVVLTYDGPEVVDIARGPALSKEEEENLCARFEHSLRPGLQVVGRDFSFNSHRVRGWWRGEKSGVQILPPPDNTPSAPVEIAEHPFILEFAVQQSDVRALTNYRRIREHRRLTQVLNVLLQGGTTLQPMRPDHFWAAVPRGGQPPGSTEITWVQEFFFSASLGRVMLDRLSEPTGSQIESVAPGKYYSQLGHDGRALRVPDNLDASICMYQRLQPMHRERFDRAAYWLDAMSRQWTSSVSASFSSLVISLEALTKRGASHPTQCTTCDWKGTHDVPGATAKLREFFDQYAPGVAPRTIQSVVKLRGSIVHGGKLMQIDQVRAFGFDPANSRELDLTRELAKWTKVALRNWLTNPPDDV